MLNNYLVPISYAAGAITTAYGAYSYYTAKQGKRPASVKQRENAKKIMALGIGLLAVGAGLSIYSSLQPKIPGYLEPYVKAMKGRAAAQASAPLKKFPGYLYKFPHPEFVATDKGWLCKIPPTLPALEKCDRFGEKMIKIVKVQAPEHLEAALKHTTRWGKGYGFGADLNLGFTQINLGMDKSIVSNYQEALEKAEEVFLQDPIFSARSDTSVIDSIKNIHKILFNNVLHKDSLQKIDAGEFRKLNAMVGDDSTVFSLEGIETALKKVGGTKADLGNFFSYIEKIRKYGSSEVAQEHFTEDEISAIRKVFFLPIYADKVPGAMIDFAKKFKEIGQLVVEKVLHPNPRSSLDPSKMWRNPSLWRWKWKSVPHFEECGLATGRNQRDCDPG